MRTKYTERLDNLRRHLQEHPRDYQSVISFMIMRSKNFDEEKRIAHVEKIKELQMYKGGWKHDQ